MMGKDWYEDVSRIDSNEQESAASDYMELSYT